MIALGVGSGPSCLEIIQLLGKCRATSWILIGKNPTSCPTCIGGRKWAELPGENPTSWATVRQLVGFWLGKIQLVALLALRASGEKIN